MDEIISKQLKKCKVANVPNFDAETTTLRISKYEELSSQILPGHYYLVELEDYILHPPEGFSLHQNWNNNIVPQSKYYKCECLQVMGKMIKIEGSGYDWELQEDLHTSWNGWVPTKSVRIIKEL